MGTSVAYRQNSSEKIYKIKQRGIDIMDVSILWRQEKQSRAMKRFKNPTG
jgi:hypothetical protein